MKRSVAAGVLVFCLSVSGVGAQESKRPFTKEEVLAALQPAVGKRVEQGELAGEIALRGIGFTADEKTLEEFRKAGARGFVISAIQQAAADAARPKLLPNPSAPEDARATEPAQPEREPTPEEIKRWPFEQQAQYHAAKFLEELPNFIVNQVVARSVQTPEKKGWQAEDTLEVELTYSDKGGEKFKLLKINGRPSTQSYENLGGATSTGEFGGYLSALFHPRSQAQLKEIKQEVFRGRQTKVYDFLVKKANSAQTLTDKTSGRKVVAGYQGTAWIDLETARILRLEHSAVDIQPGFPITMAEFAVEYDWVTIAGQKHLLPISAEVILGSDATRAYQRNVVEFRNYRVFDSDVKLILEKEQQ